MNRRPFTALVAAQFFSAAADNAILFVAIAMVFQGLGGPGGWYIPALQGTFLVAFVLLAPWVGSLADRLPKQRVLLAATGAKLMGVGLMTLGMEPLAAYALVGVGAALNGPAKYGILPELMAPAALVKGNAVLEGATIVAIVSGMVAGAALADRSVATALAAITGAYAVAWVVTLLVPRLPAKGAGGGELAAFGRDLATLTRDHRARATLVGAALFWAAAAVLRLVLVAWAPLVLASTSASDVASLSVTLALGILAGGALAPRLIPLARLHRTRYAAAAIGAAVLLLATVDLMWPARGLLFAAGVAGGLFVIPVNAALQDIGHRGIGSGRAVAIQNFWENSAMLAAVAVYTWSARGGVDPVVALVVLGATVPLAALAMGRLRAAGTAEMA